MNFMIGSYLFWNLWRAVFDSKSQTIGCKARAFLYALL